MTSAKAFAPANISCIFKIYEHKNPRFMGSYGVGFTLNEGVVVDAAESKRTEVVFDNESIKFPTVKSVIERLTRAKLRIYIRSKLPLGCGFGLSGASALATAYAVNNLLELKKSDKELAIIAHIAEVENKTGLGDVVNQHFGGFCLKLKPSSYFIVEKKPINNLDIYCRCFSKISTKSIISNPKLKYKINNSASTALDKIKTLTKNNQKIRLSDIIRISKEFSVNSGLLKDEKTMQTIKNIEKNNGNASMMMLGNAIFSDKPFKGAVKLKISDRKTDLL